ncbi:YncE family protein [Sinomicrobium soli]|uniref:YncE family protein n=1 Tax=Sinomicrobium sp. N-1-3-6 TaxID=2219864 RepID=UPI000DCCD23F|nr:YncE family protein [Sinomicrobium sp. N-1-3-6]RAV29111.1 YncE family protein [Sinomicrobium sp. N-1-3-6]
MKKAERQFLVAGTLLLTVGLVQRAAAQQIEKTVKPGEQIYEIVYNDKDHSVYVASFGPMSKEIFESKQFRSRIYKLDADDLTVSDSIDVSSAPAFGLGINRKTQTLYTSNTVSGSVSAIDLATGEAIAEITAPQGEAHTREVVVDEATNTVYVTDPGEESRVWVIDGASNTLKTTIANTGNLTTGIALDQKENVLYACNLGDNNIVEIDLKTHKVVKTFPAGGEKPTNLAYDPRGKRLFVSNQGTGNVSVLDAHSGKVIRTIPTGEGALGISFNPKKKLLYIANRQAGTVTVVDTGNYAVLKNLKTGTHPNTVAIDVKSGNAYVTNKARSDRDNPSLKDPEGDTVSLISL